MGSIFGSDSTSRTKPELPNELKPYVTKAVNQVMGAMDELPLTDFTKPHPQEIPNLTPQEVALINQVADVPLGMQGALTGSRPPVAPQTPVLPTWASQAPPPFQPTGPPKPPAPGPAQPPVTVDPNTGAIVQPTWPPPNWNLA